MLPGPDNCVEGQIDAVIMESHLITKNRALLCENKMEIEGSFVVVECIK